MCPIRGTQGVPADGTHRTGEQVLNRREFLEAGAALGTTLAGVGAAFGFTTSPFVQFPTRGFSRPFAPHFGMFRHHAGSDPIDQIRFMADEGFDAIEDCGLRGKPAALQSRIGRELACRGMEMGLFVGLADFGSPTFASGCRDLRRHVLRELQVAVDAARRVGGRSLSVVPGKSARFLPRLLQLHNAADTLRSCADICDKHGLTLLLEPIDHGAGSSRLFLQTAHQAAELCRAVGRPCCKLLFDVYQQSAGEKDVHLLLRELSPELGYVQLADYPGRKEPGTGDVDFLALLLTLDAIGYRGVLGMEHGNRESGRVGERAVIDAYRRLGTRATIRTFPGPALRHA